jgi:hypothetical protein
VIGPRLLTSTFKAVCNVTTLNSSCENFTLWPRERCFPILFNEFSKFYDENSAGEVLDKIAAAGSFFIHIWNKMLNFHNKTYELSHDSKSAYMELARSYCPLTVATKIPL